MGYNRRDFLKLLAATGAAAVVAPGLAQESRPTATKSDGLPARKLGKTGIRASVLGFGTGSTGWNKQSNQTRLGREEFVSLLEYSHDRGVTYFDMADQYGSHTYVRDALKENGGSIPRDKVMLLTKSVARTKEEMERDLDRFRKEVGTEYFDVVLLHCKTASDWNKSHAGAMEALSAAKEKGIVRAHGVSCHSLAALETAAVEPWVEVDLARYNPWGAHMDADVDTVRGVLQRMKLAGKGVIGMKILADGDRNTGTDVEVGLRHAMKSEELDIFTVGFESREQIDKVIETIGKYQG